MVRRLDEVGADKPDGHDRCTGGRGEPGGAQGATVEHPVARAGPFGVDTYDTAVGEHAEIGVEGSAGSRWAAAP